MAFAEELSVLLPETSCVSATMLSVGPCQAWYLDVAAEQLHQRTGVVLSFKRGEVRRPLSSLSS